MATSTEAQAQDGATAPTQAQAHAQDGATAPTQAQAHDSFVRTPAATEGSPTQAQAHDSFVRTPAATEGGELTVKRPHCLTDAPFSYCPGCGHGIATRILAELIDELGLEGQTVGVCPVGCSVTMYDFFNLDMVEAAHGRAPAVATGIKRVLPETFVFSYQGDGDLASIGMAETIHAATRGENITVIFINNAIYGMTGGQMAPTSIPGQITQTSPYGRDTGIAGYPVRVCELLSQLDGVALAQRVTIDTPAHVKQAKRAIKQGIEYQREKLGYSIIEVVSTCPTNWGLDPVESMQWLRDNMLPYYPLGVYKDVKAGIGVRDAGGAGAATAGGSQDDAATATAGAGLVPTLRSDKPNGCGEEGRTAGASQDAAATATAGVGLVPTQSCANGAADPNDATQEEAR